MGVHESVYLIAHLNNASFLRMALEDSRHWVMNDARDRTGSIEGVDETLPRMTFAVVDDSVFEEGSRQARAFAHLRARAPEVTLVAFSRRSPNEIPEGTILFKREGGPQDFFDVASFVTKLKTPQRQ